MSDEMRELHVEFYEKDGTTWIKIYVITMGLDRIMLADTECDFVHMKIRHKANATKETN